MSKATSLSDIVLQFDEEIDNSATELLQLVDVQIQYLMKGNDFSYSLVANSQAEFVLSMSTSAKFFVRNMYISITNPQQVFSKTGNQLSGITDFEFKIGPILEDNSGTGDGISYFILGTTGLIILINIFMYFKLEKKSLCTFWGLFDFLQLYNLLLFVDCNLMSQLTSSLNCTFYANLYIQPLYKALSTPDPQNLPIAFQREDYGEKFIFNSLICLILIGFSIIMLVVVKLFCYKQNQQSQPIKEFFYFGFILRVMMFTSCQIILGIFISFKVFSDDIAHGLVAILFFIFFLIFLLFAFYLLNNENTLSTQYFTLYGILYKDLILKAFFKRNFFIFWIIRKMAIAILVLFINNDGMAQIFIIILIQIWYFTIISMKWPYKNNINNYIFIFGEFLTLLFISMLLMESVFDYLGDGFVEMTTRSNINWVMTIFFIMGYLVRVLGISLELLTQYKNKKLKDQQEEQEDYNKDSIQEQDMPDDLMFIELQTIDDLKKIEEDNEKELQRKLEEEKKLEEQKINEQAGNGFNKRGGQDLNQDSDGLDNSKNDDTFKDEDEEDYNF